MESAKILYIDDDQDLSRDVAKILYSWGYIPYTAPTLSRGVTLLHNKQPDLLLLDITLPDGNGYEFCKSLRNDPPTANLPVLMLTAHGGVDAWLRGFQAGANDYLCKPFLNAELKERVEFCLSGRALNLGKRADQAEYQLVQAAASGNRGAFEILFRKYKDQLYGSMTRVTGNTTEAEDIVSSAYVQAFKNLKWFKGGSSFYTWLYEIALNDFYKRCRDHPSFSTAWATPPRTRRRSIWVS